MFNKLTESEKATIKAHTNELVSLSFELVKANKRITEQDELIKKLYKDNWHLNYKITKLLGAMQLEWVDNELVSKRRKK